MSTAASSRSAHMDAAVAAAASAAVAASASSEEEEAGNGGSSAPAEAQARRTFAVGDTVLVKRDKLPADCDLARNSTAMSFQGVLTGKTDVPGKMRKQWLVRFEVGGVSMEVAVHGKSMVHLGAAPVVQQASAATAAAAAAAAAAVAAVSEGNGEEKDGEWMQEGQGEGDEQQQERQGAEWAGEDEEAQRRRQHARLVIDDAEEPEEADMRREREEISAGETDTNRVEVVDGDDLPDGVQARVTDGSGSFVQDWEDAGMIMTDARSEETWEAQLLWGQTPDSAEQAAVAAAAAAASGDDAATAAAAAAAANAAVEGVSPLHYFMLLFPAHEMDNMAAHTTEALKALDPSAAPTTASELWKLFGCLFAMTVVESPTGTREGYWNVLNPADKLGTIVPAPDFGRFMQRRRFNALLRAFRLSAREPEVEALDRTAALSQFLDAWNTRRAAVLRPGYLINVFDSLPPTGPDQGSYAAKLAGKQGTLLGVASDLRSAVCADSRITIQLELKQGRASEALKKYCERPSIPANTAVVLRLMEPWQGTPYVVVGDSTLSSVSTATALKAEHGMYFIGPITKATARYPRDFLNELPTAERGDFHTLVTAADHIEGPGGEPCDPVQVYAHLWDDTITYYGKTYGERKLFVATCGKNTPEDPQVKYSYKRAADGSAESCTKEVKRQHMVKLYYDAAPSLATPDEHRSRVAWTLEEAWGSSVWWQSIFANILALTESDAFNGYRKWRPEGANMSHIEFTRTLCREMLTMDAPDSSLPPHSTLSHTLRPNRTLPQYRDSTTKVRRPNHDKGGNRPRGTRHCSICHKQASYHCALCTQAGHVVTICGPSTGRNCHEMHIAQAR